MSDDSSADDDTISFSGKTNTFKEITMEHVRRITLLSSCELRGGYYTTFVTKAGEQKEHYVEDSREALENAIYTLAQLLMSRFTKEAMEQFRKFEEVLQKQKEDFLKKTKLDESEVLGEGHYHDGEEKIWLEEYKIQKLWMYRHFFTQLILLLASKNFLEAGAEMF